MSYDESGRPFMITYNNISYYYLLNLQGDVVGIMNVSGDLQVAYTYDAWGNVLSITGPMADTMGQYNQLRYRGYVYDPETGLYFLNSRFYDPEKGRFINADVLVATGQGMLGNNMFAYCGNNPVNYQDPTGKYYIQLTAETDPDRKPCAGFAGGGGIVGIIIVAKVIIDEVFGEYLPQPVPEIPAHKQAYLYRKQIAEELANASKSIPNVHHIVPVGAFSSRSETTQQYIQEMHSVLAEVGINRYIDPINLVLVSAGTHAKLNTDDYIAHVHSYIMEAGNNKLAIYAALFALRIEIAAMDALAVGF